MKTLISILKEEKEQEQPPQPKSLSGSILNDKIESLMSGRPSEEIKNLKGKAQSDPQGLLKSVGINFFPGNDSKIKNLEEIFNSMISGKNVSKDSPAKNFATFFQPPERVKSPSGKAPGLLIKLTPLSKKAISESGSVKKSLRIFSFWFASIVTAINSVKSAYFDININNFKFQFASGQQAILIYVSSGKPWKNL